MQPKVIKRNIHTIKHTHINKRWLHHAKHWHWIIKGNMSFSNVLMKMLMLMLVQPQV